MSSLPHIQLLVPGLCGPLPIYESLAENKVLVEVYSQLAKAVQQPLFSHSVEDLLIQLFGLNPAQTLPSAALSLAGYLADDAGGNGAQPLLVERAFIRRLLAENYYFLHADPVHLRAEMDHAVLAAGSQELTISSQEAEAMSAKLSQHFRQDGVEVFAVDATHWFVAIKKAQTLHTTRLTDAIGRNVNFILPEGEDATYWKSFLNEAQMLLHLCEANQQREQNGQQTLNSIWLHGGGQLPSSVHPAINSVVSDNIMVCGLAKQAGRPFYQCSDCLDPCSSILTEKFYTDINNQSEVMIYLDTLLPWLPYMDTTMWQQQVIKLYQQWFAPLLEQVRAGKLTMDIYPDNKQKYRFSRHYALRFWRQAKIEDYVSVYA